MPLNPEESSDLFTGVPGIIFAGFQAFQGSGAPDPYVIDHLFGSQKHLISHSN